ncbi:hypothetical protein [Aquimarina sp. 2304DJ70-9]|uniref:hypothetical protein n=1 Tax=Aquimarina penaris TaxID=3231044 RepID=UPI003461AED4
MKKLILLLILLTSCNFEKKKTQVDLDKETEISKAEGTKKPEKKYYFKTDSLHIYEKLFKKMFVAQQDDDNDGFYQALFVNWISEDKIEYKLFYENQLCSGECKGTAINKNSNSGSEVDEYNGVTYATIKYEDKKDDFTIIIKIDAVEKNKATAGIFIGEYTDDCSPYESVMLEQK